jgi:hypothetical protein
VVVNFIFILPIVLSVVFFRSYFHVFSLFLFFSF